MIIDFHTHMFPDKIAEKAVGKLALASHSRAFTDGTADGLRASMERAGIDISVVLPVVTSPAQTRRINERAAALDGDFNGSGLYSFGGIHPDSPDWKDELEEVKALGIKGIKVHPYYHEMNFDDIRYLRVLEKCAELGLVVVTHSGFDIGFPGVQRCSPQMVGHALREIAADQAAGFQLVLAHMGGWRCWDEVRELLPPYPVMLDMSLSGGRFFPLPDGYWKEEDTIMMDEEQFMGMIRAFGPERILFATDSPWSDQKESVRALEALPLAPGEKELILSGNAMKLLGL